MTVEAHIALNRFGLGARPSEAGEIADARSWLLHQVQDAEPLPPALYAAAELDDLFQGGQDAIRDPLTFAQRSRAAYRRQAAAQLEWWADADQGFRERLVSFWSNHFAISTDKPQAAAWGLPQSLYGIRPHVTGDFEDLLIAAVQHPSMLLYLDNARSIGPQSMVGERRDRGLNENLAREVLELHTLGVDGGYDQADVEGLARALTGWTTGSVRYRPDAIGDFLFVPAAHQPGSVSVLGKRYGQAGVQQGLAILRDLARHPATATHLATKLARHFTADDPNDALVAALTEAYRGSGGNLMAMYRTLINHPASWAQGLAKYRSPQDYLVAATRAVGIGSRLNGERITRSLYALGQPLWQPGSPAGWPEDSEQWLSPAALMARIEWTQLLVQRQPRRGDIETLAQQLLGDNLSEHTQNFLRRAPDARAALTLLLLSPEFQQR
ncbi:MAG: DUF1800 domain-containing protein [Pseudomonadota bacterium]